jgi:hypothetical protein
MLASMARTINVNVDTRTTGCIDILVLAFTLALLLR